MPVLAQFRRDPIGFLRALAVNGDSTIPFQIGRHTLVLLNEPDLIEQVLVTQQTRFQKGPGLLRSRDLLGDGLLTSDGVTHRAHRRQLQPAFHGREMPTYAETMIAKTMRWSENWRDGGMRDIHGDMMRLTLNIVAAALFSSDVEPNASEVADAIVDALNDLYGQLGSDACPHAPNGDAAKQKLEHALESVIAGRQEHSSKTDLISAISSDGAKDFTPEQIRDEAMTFFLAGHESVANALSWTWYLLAQHPEVAQRFFDELDQVLGDRTPNPSDLDALPYTKQILSEAMRLYPPAWMISRQARESVPIGDQVWPAETIFIAAQCVTHVDPRFYSDAMRFDPDRWYANSSHMRPRFAYFPFGGGSRICIGERFAWTELLAVLAVLGPKWRLSMPEGSETPKWDPLVTLRPKHGLPMIVTQRP